MMLKDLKALDWRQLARDEMHTFISVTVGTIIVCFYVVALTVPYKFAGCGVTGIALITTYVWGISPVWVVTIANMLLLLWGWRSLSTRFALWTLYVSLLTSVVMPLFEMFEYPTLQNHVLAAIFCGMVGGLGFGMMFRVGASSGGTDVVVMVARKRWNMEVGQASFYLNVCILAANLFILEFEQVMLGVLVLYVESLMVDNVVRSFNRRTQVTVISPKAAEIKEFVLKELERSATVVATRGAYSGEAQEMLIIVMTRRQVALLRAFLAGVDPRAFVVFSDVNEVVGEGFHRW